MTAAPQVGEFARAGAIADRLTEVAAEFGLPTQSIAQVVTSLVVELVDQPNTVFEEPPVYRRPYAAEPVTGPGPTIGSTHDFFSVVRARASRRDFALTPLDQDRLVSLLAWTFGRRGTEIAYDFRGAPLRYVPSAGGLASTDGYVVVNRVDGLAPGSYYYDFERGLVPLVAGHMSHKLAALLHDSDWVARAAVVVICVVDTSRVAHKYGTMGAKLGLLDAGVALGHLELVANALELRGTLLGGLPADDVAALVGLPDTTLIPVGGLAVGTRGGDHH